MEQSSFETGRELNVSSDLRTKGGVKDSSDFLTLERASPAVSGFRIPLSTEWLSGTASKRDGNFTGDGSENCAACTTFSAAIDICHTLIKRSNDVPNLVDRILTSWTDSNIVQ